jgi:dual specificity protein phosphatase-like protein
MIRFREPPASFDRITEFIFLGSRIATLDDFHRLKAHGVRACVDMKQEGADPWTFDAFLWLPTVDHEPPSPMHLRMGIAFLRQCEQGRLPVFVHCMAGVGRSSTLVLAHLMAGEFKHRSVEDGLAFLCSRRACVNPNAQQIAAAVEAAKAFRD